MRFEGTKVQKHTHTTCSSKHPIDSSTQRYGRGPSSKAAPKAFRQVLTTKLPDLPCNEALSTNKEATESCQAEKSIESVYTQAGTVAKYYLAENSILHERASTEINCSSIMYKYAL